MIRINNTTIGFFFFWRTAFKWFCLPAQVCLFQVCSASESPSKVRNGRVLTMATACSIVLPASSFIEYLNLKQRPSIEWSLAKWCQPFSKHKRSTPFSLKNFSSILDDSYFRVYSWPPSNFWIGPNNLKETNHLIFSSGPWPLHCPNTTQQKIHKSPIS